ncbi:MAG: hypothetical protein V4864_07410 [Pseudomonadota bacterium]
MTAERARHRVVITVGRIPIAVRTADAAFVRMLRRRYEGFLESGADLPCEYEFDVELSPPAGVDPDADVQVSRRDEAWVIERGDFRAEWDPRSRHGHIRQAANPYSIDSVLRIVHTLILAMRGGCLVHSASAVRGGKAYLFAGVSGAGKTTISRLAPRDVKVLTDEVSYVCREPAGYRAYGTPFAGELGRPGANVDAPLAGVFLLAQGPENRIDPVPPAQAARAMLGNTLFFAQDAALVRGVFDGALDLVQSVPVRQLTFVPDARVWDLVGCEETA